VSTSAAVPPLPGPRAASAPPAPQEAHDTANHRPGAAEAAVPFDDPIAQAAFTEWRTAEDGEREGTSRLRVTGMYCAACAGVVEGALLRLPGVTQAQVNAGTQRLLLRWRPHQVPLSRLAAAVGAAGYGLLPDVAAGAREQRQREQRQALWRLFVAAFCMMQVMMMAVPLYFAGPGDIPDDQRRLLNWGAWMFSVPVMLFAAGPFFTSAWQQLRQRRIGMDVPVSVALLVTFVASTGAAFAPGGWFGHEVYFDSLTMFVCFLLVARTLEQRARHRVVSALEDTIDRLPSGVQRLRPDGSVETVAPLQLSPGDRVRVLRGEGFPADGVVLEGRTRADEALLTGESQALHKDPGSEVVAGSMNLDAPVVMRVERVGEHTRYEAIVALMREALVQRPRLLRAADRVAGPFLWAVLALAAGGAAAWSAIDPSRAVWVAVSVLVVTCPCALSLAAPSALLAAAGALARRGVLIQHLDALEPLARIQRLYFDKTGTLTEDRLELAGIFGADGEPLDAVSAQSALARAAGLAGWSSHPLSRALADAARDAGLAAARWTDVREEPGKGLSAALDEAPVPKAGRLGSAAWVLGHDDPSAAAGGTASVWLSVRGGAAVRFALRETLRAGTAEALQALRADGVDVSLLSGDRIDRVQAVARRLDIDDARGGATPEDKLSAVAVAQSRGEVVGMVGDGLNDAPVLARADVSFAMGQGALLSRQRADAIVLSMRLADIVQARAVAQRAVRIVRQNLAWAVGYNAICIPVALAGWLPPWLAGLGMALSSLAVVLNALRLTHD
jgi:Cu2+-exporting ATPase